jgi:P4 family phage/plasmid primase-like protien
MYQIPKTALTPFYEANQLVIPISDPTDQSLPMSYRGKRPIKGLSFRRLEPAHRFPYEMFHNAAWVVRDSVVIDIDPRNGGKEGYAKLCEMVGCDLHKLGAPMVTTGGGGKHIYLSLPEHEYIGVAGQTVLKKRFEIDGIEIKSGNGFVIIPGSRHVSGAYYTWDNPNVTIGNTALPLAPFKFYEMIEKEAEGVALTGGLSSASTMTHDQERARMLVAEYEGAGSGERNEQMWRLAVRLRDFGMDSTSAHEHLAAANDKNHPPLSQREIHDIYKKASSYAKNEFGALSLASDFDEIDTDVVLSDGTRLSPEEALAQFSEVTGRDEAIAAAQELIDLHEAGNDAKFDEMLTDNMRLIAAASKNVIRRCKNMLISGGREKAMSASDFDEFIATSQNTTSEDLPETIGMTVLSNIYGGQRLRYTQKSFFTFNPNMWHKVDDKEVQNHIINECNRLRSENPELGFSNASVSMNAINLLQARTHIRPEKFFPHVDRQPPRILNCHNGELHVSDTGELDLREPDPASRMFHSLNVNWNPEADCPTYKRVLMEVFQHCDNPKEVVRHYLEVKGYHMLPRKPLPVIEVGVGSGANGKSLLNSTVVTGVLGRESVGQGPLTMFMKDTSSATARLENKLLWIDPDMDATKPLPASLLKTLSENGMLTIEPKYMDAYNIMSICSWSIMANELPVSRDASKGLARRMYLFPYDHDFDESGEADLGLADKLLDEKEGIFRLWVEGASRFLARGTFDPPEECLRLRDEWMSTQNAVGAFVSECCEYHATAETDGAEMYEAFVRFCVADGTPREDVMKRHTFTKRLNSSSGRIKVDRRGGNKGVVCGLSLKAGWAAEGAAADFARVDSFEQADAGLPDWLQ